jgi:hypothetical protein
MDSQSPRDAEVDEASMTPTQGIPCPFCGSSELSYRVDDYGFARRVRCRVCKCDDPLLEVQPGTKEAAMVGVVRKWNNRIWIDSEDDVL